MDDKIRNVKDLTGKVVAVQTGTSYLENVKKVAAVKEIKNFPQDTDARAALVSGRVVADTIVAEVMVQTLRGLDMKFPPAPPNLADIVVE